MATQTANAQLSFNEQANRTNNKELVRIFEAVNSNQDDMLKFLPWFEADEKDAHNITRRTSIPTPTLRKDNEGVVPTASTTQRVKEPMATLEDRSEIDERHVDRIQPSKRKQYRRNEDMAHIEGMGQKLAKLFIFGTTNNAGASASEGFNGLQQRLASTGLTTVISNGGSNSGTMTSIYVVKLGIRGAYMIHPAPIDDETFMGLAVRDKGKEFRVTNTTTGKGLYKYVTQFIWNAGLAVEDELAIGRLANIDITTALDAPFDEDNLIELIDLGHFGAGTIILMNKTIKTQMRIRMKDKQNHFWNLRQGLSGAEILHFDEIPVIGLDTNIITNVETTVGA